MKNLFSKGVSSSFHGNYFSLITDFYRVGVSNKRSMYFCKITGDSTDMKFLFTGQIIFFRILGPSNP